MKPDILDEMSKEELLQWIRQEMFFRKPTKRWLLFERWKKQSELLSKKFDDYLKMNDGVDFKIRDIYAQRFNATTDIDEKMRLMKLMEPYDKRLKEWIAVGRKLDKEQTRVDSLYEEMRKEEDKIK